MEGKKQSEMRQAEIDQMLTDMVASWAAQYAPLLQLYRDMLAHQAALLPQMAYGIAKKVAGSALEQNAEAGIEEICQRAIKTMVHEPKLCITIHESLKERIEEKLRMAAKNSQFSGDIQVVGDPHIALPNCRIEWKNGAMIRDTESLWQQVEQVIGNMVASSRREAESLCDSIQAMQAATPEADTADDHNSPPKAE